MRKYAQTNEEFAKAYHNMGDGKYKDGDYLTAINFLKKQIKLPSDYIMDNLIFYNEYEIIGNRNIKNEDLDFPIS